MPVHAHAERLNTLYKQERIERAETGTQVAQAFHAAADDEGDRAEDLAKVHAVIGARGLIDLRMLALAPIEFAAIDDHSADGVAMAAHEFGQRVHHNIRAVVDGP